MKATTKTRIKSIIITAALTLVAAFSLTACGDNAGADADYKVAIVKYVDDASLNQIEDAIIAQIEAKEKELGVTIDVQKIEEIVFHEYQKANISSHTVNGLRVTSEDMIDIVQSTLIGKVNPALVHELNVAGITAVGLNGFDGPLLESAYLDKETYGFVGEVTNVNTALLDALTAVGIVPVVACIGATKEGQALNINGDTVASEIALAVKAESLLLVTDVAGIRINDEYQKEVTEADIPFLNAKIDRVHFYTSLESNLSDIMSALNDPNTGVPTDVDIDAVAADFVKELEWHLYEG